LTDEWGEDATTLMFGGGGGAGGHARDVADVGDAPGAAAAPAVGVALAGGASRRMGRDKTGLALAGETLAARAARRLLAVCSAVAVADGGRGLVPGLPWVADGPGRGPAAGILGAARAWPGRALLVLACDLPLVPTPLLAALRDTAAAVDWAVPRRDGRLEPLCALYGPAALAELAAGVARGVMAPHRLGESATLSVRYVEGEGLARFGDPEEIFLNLNAPADVERWLAIEGARRGPRDGTLRTGSG
jgi:molybdopterin-guanine dinucleotide biosynthesis protein A